MTLTPVGPASMSLKCESESLINSYEEDFINQQFTYF